MEQSQGTEDDRLAARKVVAVAYLRDGDVFSAAKDILGRDNSDNRPV